MAKKRPCGYNYINFSVAAAFSKFAEEARSIGRAVNESKTNLLLSITTDTSIGISVEIDCYNFVVVKDFVYLGSRTNTDNDISLEIRRRITLANRYYYGLRKQLSKRSLSCRTKLCLYKLLILPEEEQALGVIERKIKRTIYGPFCD